MKIIKNIAIFITLPLHLFPQASADIGISLGKGLKEMSDLNIIGFNFSAGYQAKCSPWGFGIFGSQRNQLSRTEYLPMQTEFSGFDENVEISNTSQSATLLFVSSYNTIIKHSRWRLYSSIGIGFATYSTLWSSAGKPVEDSPTFLGNPLYIHHLDDGSHLRNILFNSSGELGVEFLWSPNEHQFSSKSSGIYIRSELGGNAKYLNPRKFDEHFYYESGLGELKNTPFGSNYYNVARHFTLAVRIVLFKMVI